MVDSPPLKLHKRGTKMNNSHTKTCFTSLDIKEMPDTFVDSMSSHGTIPSLCKYIGKTECKTLLEGM